MATGAKTLVKTSAAVPAPETETERQLTKAQESLLEVLRDERVIGLDVVQICKLANITRPTYYASFRDKSFLAALEEAVQTMLIAAEPAVIQNVVRKASDPAIKSHHWAMMVEKMRGRMEEKNQKPANIVVNFGGGIVRPKIAVSPTGSMIIEGEAMENDS